MLSHRASRCRRWAPILLCTAFAALASIPVAQSQTRGSTSPRRDAIFARRGYIRIGLPQGGATLSVSSSAPVRLSSGSGPAQAAAAGSISLSASRGTVQACQNGRTLASGASVTIAPSSSASLAVGGNSYRGKISAQARGGSIRLINELMIDDWLKGVLPAEIGGDSLPEALKAQAVAARSEAIHKLLKPPHESDGYDFCTGVHCQAYKGMKLETEASNQACDATLGFVILANGDVMDAVYHNVCGGVTAAAEDVWDGNPEAGLTPVFDMADARPRPNLSSDAAMERFLANPGNGLFCNSSNPGYASYAKKYYRWTRTISGEQLRKLSGVGTVKDIVVTERRPSGRVRKLTVIGSGGRKTIEKELPIRNTFDLWSGLFIVRTEKNADGSVRSASFIGGGNGHGVGLCQHGAREMARRGAGYAQILSHYYRGTTISKIYRP